MPLVYMRTRSLSFTFPLAYFDLLILLPLKMTAFRCSEPHAVSSPRPRLLPKHPQPLVEQNFNLLVLPKFLCGSPPSSLIKRRSPPLWSLGVQVVICASLFYLMRGTFLFFHFRPFLFLPFCEKLGFSDSGLPWRPPPIPFSPPQIDANAKSRDRETPILVPPDLINLPCSFFCGFSDFFFFSTFSKSPCPFLSLPVWRANPLVCLPIVLSGMSFHKHVPNFPFPQPQSFLLHPSS